MTCRELAEKLLETPDMPITFFYMANSLGCKDIRVGKEMLWCDGKREEYRTIRVNYYFRNNDKFTFSDEKGD